MSPRVLVLGGTAQARRLTADLANLADLGGVEVIYSLAGRVATPRLPPGVRARVGGFRGVDGLVGFLRSEDVAAVVDATHPYAAVMTESAVLACGAAEVPLLVVRRPGWEESPGDDWRRVPSLDAAAAALSDSPADTPNPPDSVAAVGPDGPGRGRRVFLTTGRSGVSAFAGLRHWFLLRSIEPPRPPVPPRLRVLLDRGPFTVDDELALMRRHAVDVLVTKDSGGTMTAAKLVAARHLGLPVVMVDRPPLPPGTAVATDPSAAVVFVTEILG